MVAGGRAPVATTVREGFVWVIGVAIPSELVVGSFVANDTDLREALFQIHGWRVHHRIGSHVLVSRNLVMFPTLRVFVAEVAIVAPPAIKPCRIELARQLLFLFPCERRRRQRNARQVLMQKSAVPIFAVALRVVVPANLIIVLSGGESVHRILRTRQRLVNGFILHTTIFRWRRRCNRDVGAVCMQIRAGFSVRTVARGMPVVAFEGGRVDVCSLRSGLRPLSNRFAGMSRRRWSYGDARIVSMEVNALFSTRALSVHAPEMTG